MRLLCVSEIAANEVIEVVYAELQRRLLPYWLLKLSLLSLTYIHTGQHLLHFVAD